MADSSSGIVGGSVDVYYSIHKDLPSIKITEYFMGMDNIQTIYLSDITEIFGELPPHMTFIGWHSPELNQIFMEKIEISTTSWLDSIELQAKWEINTNFKFKGATIFDFTKGGINATTGDLIEGTVAYNAQGFPIQGIVPNAAEVSF